MWPLNPRFARFSCDSLPQISLHEFVHEVVVIFPNCRRSETFFSISLSVPYLFFFIVGMYDSELAPDTICMLMMATSLSFTAMILGFLRPVDVTQFPEV